MAEQLPIPGLTPAVAAATTPATGLPYPQVTNPANPEGASMSELRAKPSAAVLAPVQPPRKLEDSNPTPMAMPGGDIITIPRNKVADGVAKYGLKPAITMWHPDGNSVTFMADKAKLDIAKQRGLTASKPIPATESAFAKQGVTIPKVSGMSPQLAAQQPGQDPLGRMKTEHVKEDQSFMGRVNQMPEQARKFWGSVANNAKDEQMQYMYKAFGPEAAGKSTPERLRSEAMAWVPGVEQAVAEIAGGLTDPKVAALMVASKIAPIIGVVGFGGQGLKGIVDNVQDIWKNGANPDNVHSLLMAGAQTVGSAAGAKSLERETSHLGPLGKTIANKTANTLEGYNFRLAARKGYGDYGDRAASESASRNVSFGSKLKNQEAQLNTKAAELYRQGKYTEAGNLTRSADSIGRRANAVIEGRVNRSMLHMLHRFPESFTEGAVLTAAGLGLWGEITEGVNALVSHDLSGGASGFGKTAVGMALTVGLRTAFKSIPSATARMAFFTKVIDLLKERQQSMSVTQGPMVSGQVVPRGGIPMPPSGLRPQGQLPGPTIKQGLLPPGPPPEGPTGPANAVTEAINKAGRMYDPKTGRFTKRAAAPQSGQNPSGAGPNNGPQAPTAPAAPNPPNGPTGGPGEPVKPPVKVEGVVAPPQKFRPDGTPITDPETIAKEQQSQHDQARELLEFAEKQRKEAEQKPPDVPTQTNAQRRVTEGEAKQQDWEAQFEKEHGREPTDAEVNKWVNESRGFKSPLEGSSPKKPMGTAKGPKEPEFVKPLEMGHEAFVKFQRWLNAFVKKNGRNPEKAERDAVINKLHISMKGNTIGKEIDEWFRKQKPPSKD